MTRFDTWYRQEFLKGAEWSCDYSETPVYKAMKKSYYAGLKSGLRKETK